MVEARARQGRRRKMHAHSHGAFREPVSQPAPASRVHTEFTLFFCELIPGGAGRIREQGAMWLSPQAETGQMSSRRVHAFGDSILPPPPSQRGPGRRVRAEESAASSPGVHACGPALPCPAPSSLSSQRGPGGGGSPKRELSVNSRNSWRGQQVARQSWLAKRVSSV